MDLHEPTLTMQVLADENLCATIMENVDDPQTLFNLVLALPTAKEIFERFPRQLLTATLSSLPSELEQLVILYIALIQDDPSRASVVPLLEDYLRLDDTSDSVLPTVAAASLTISTHISNSFETLRKVAVVWNAVEDLAGGYVECSINFIKKGKSAPAAHFENEHYDYGHIFRPVSYLWDQEANLGLLGYQTEAKPQPWSLPPRPSEIHRVKRAMWRLEVLVSFPRAPHLPEEEL